MALSERRICVTGASGFTGQHLVKRLSTKGAQIFAAATDQVDSVFDVRNVDVSDRSALISWLSDVQPTHVVHLAALSHVVGEALPFYQVNTLGTEALIEAVAAAAPDLVRLIIASSANVYGNAEELPINEDVPLRPVNHYALSKMAAEMVARKWFSRLPIVVTRPFNYTGCGQDESFVFAKIVAAFGRRDSVITLGNLDVRRDLSDVRFVCAAYDALLDADCASTFVNICSGASVSIREALALLRQLTGHDPQIRSEDRLLRPDEIRELVGDDSRLRHIIGDISRPTIEDTFRWMLEGDWS